MDNFPPHFLICFLPTSPLASTEIVPLTSLWFPPFLYLFLNYPAVNRILRCSCKILGPDVQTLYNPFLGSGIVSIMNLTPVIRFHCMKEMLSSQKSWLWVHEKRDNPGWIWAIGEPWKWTGLFLGKGDWKEKNSLAGFEETNCHIWERTTQRKAKTPLAAGTSIWLMASGKERTQS